MAQGNSIMVCIQLGIRAPDVRSKSTSL